MKKNSSTVFRTIFVILTTLVIAVCVYAGVYAFSIINNPDIITIGIGENYTLTPRETDYTLRSYNAEIISPASGSSITGNALGEGIVGIKYNYFDRDFYRFKVIDAPTKLTLNKTELCLGVGETFSLSADFATNSHNFAVTYHSTNNDIATVTSDGEITAVDIGSCEIIADTYNNIESRCKITVMSAPTSITLNESSVVLGEGEECSLTATFEKKEFSNSLTYLSSDENVATIENEVIKAKGVGECEITVTTYNGTNATCKVIVKKLPDTVSLFIPEKHIVGTKFPVLYGIDDDSAVNDVEITVSDNTILKIDENDKMLINCLKKGNASVTLTLPNGVTSSKNISVDNYTANAFRFKVLNQYPTLPTGCEVVSLTSVLNHYGMDVSMTTMADEYLPKVSYDYYSVSPHDYFLGNPYSIDGCGCFSGCIVKTAENYFEANDIDDYIAVNISGCSPDELYSYLENDIPVITWVTSGFADPYVSGSWVAGDEVIKWCNHEHCLVTIGYDKINNTVTVADDSGGYNYTVSRSQYEKVFKGMGSMAVVLLKK